jgi:hypothetical protein
MAMWQVYRTLLRPDQPGLSEMGFWQVFVLRNPRTGGCRCARAGCERDEMVSRALRHGQEAVLLWDENGISVVSTTRGTTHDLDQVTPTSGEEGVTGQLLSGSWEE